MNYCINCGKVATELHHVVPLAVGGKDIDTNKVWLCSECHTLVHGFNMETRGTNWKELQRAGIERAKKEGKYKGRAKIKFDECLFMETCADWRAGKITAVKAMEIVGLKPNTFYRRVKEYEL